MKKIVIHAPGGYDRLELEDHPDPTPQGDEVVVRTQGIGVNYADCCVRWGVYEPAKRYVGWPITPGFEFSGAVVAAGPRARHAVGSQVFGITRFNAYATHVCAPSHQVFARPAALSSSQAAGFTGVYMTAYHATFQLVRIRPGGTVLIHSAAGGVGSALLQMCKVAGLRSVAVVGASHKLEFAKRFGADEVIDKSQESLWQRARALSPGGYDAIFDANGYTTLRRGYELLAPSGKLICYGSHALLPTAGGRLSYLKAGLGLLRTPRFNPLQMLTENRTVAGFNVAFLFERTDLLNEGMTALLGWLGDRKIQPPAVTEFSFDKVADAHRLIESAQSVGKLVLVSAGSASAS
jgi:synaptic vesicle membrane protein VAT-1